MSSHSPPTKQYNQARIVSESCFTKDAEGLCLKEPHLRLQKKAFLFSYLSGTCSQLDHILLISDSAFPFQPGLNTPWGGTWTSDPSSWLPGSEYTGSAWVPREETWNYSIHHRPHFPVLVRHVVASEVPKGTLLSRLCPVLICPAFSKLACL